MFILIRPWFLIRDPPEGMNLRKRIKPKETFRSEHEYIRTKHESTEIFTECDFLPMGTLLDECSDG